MQHTSQAPAMALRPDMTEIKCCQVSRKALTRTGCSAANSSQGIAEEGGNVLLIGCRGEPSYIDTPGVPGRLL